MTDEADLRVRHLDTLQNIISRLSQNSFTVRGWSITLVTAALAVLATQEVGGPVVLFALLPSWIFWGLDASYVRTERLFRALYDAAVHRLNNAAAIPDIKPFDTDIAPFRGMTASWLRTLASPSVAAVPLILTVAVVGYALIKR
jgi:hypothetical protein